MIFAGSLLLFALVGAYNFVMLDSVRDQAEKESLAATEAQARLGVLFVADHQQGLLKRLSAIVSRNSVRQALQGMDLETLRAYLTPLVIQNPEIASALLWDQGGSLLLQVTESAQPQPDAEALLAAGHGSLDQPAISSVHESRLGKMVSLSAPIINQNGGPMGVLSILQRPTLWQRFLSNFAARPGRHFYLFDQKGTQIAVGPGPESSKNPDMSSLARRACQEIRKKGGPITRLAQPSSGELQAFVSAATVDEQGWVLVVAQDYAMAMAPTLALSRNIRLFLLVLLLCQVLMGFLLASRYRMQQHALMKTDEQARRLEAEVIERTADLSALTERYRTLLENLPDIVYEVDSNGSITIVSGAAESVLGYSPREMIGKTFRSFLMPEDRPKFAVERSRVEKGHTVSIMALRFQPKHGEVRWLSIHSRGIFDGQGNLTGRRGVARDVTQQVLAEMQVHELSGKLINAQEEERQRLALDLHDELGQLLSALKIGLQSLGKESAPEQARELQRLTLLSQTVMDRVRALAYNLRPAILDNFGLVAAVRDLCDSLDESGLLHVRCRLSEVEAQLPADYKLPLFRCAQEALHNVIKHSGSPQAEVRLYCRRQTVCLEISDQGRGFDPQNTQETSHGGRYLGLLGMRERMRLIGGSLLVESSPKGTTIKAEVPVGEGV